MVIRRLPRLTQAAAALLALAVATGIALPRPRFLGRERAARNLTVPGSSRPDQPCAWVFPRDPDPDVAAPTDTETALDPLITSLRAWLPPAAAAGLAPVVAARLLDTPPPPVALDRLRAGRPAGRAPPPSRA